MLTENVYFIYKNKCGNVCFLKFVRVERANQSIVESFKKARVKTVTCILLKEKPPINAVKRYSLIVAYKKNDFKTFRILTDVGCSKSLSNCRGAKHVKQFF